MCVQPVRTHVLWTGVLQQRCLTRSTKGGCDPRRTTSSVKGVRSFLGMATYCAKFIPNFSDLTEPLRELTTKNTPFRWTSRHAKAFNDVKTALTSQTVMAYFDKAEETELITDASQALRTLRTIYHEVPHLRPRQMSHAPKKLPTSTLPSRHHMQSPNP